VFGIVALDVLAPGSTNRILDDILEVLVGPAGLEPATER